jgi:hypothetical protein
MSANQSANAQSSLNVGIKLTSIIDNIYIIYPPACHKEGEEHEKIMFFYPKTETNDSQLQSIGFCEATVKFTSSFIEGAWAFYILHLLLLLSYY